MIALVTRKRLVRAAASGLIGVTILAGAFAQTKKLGDGLSSEGAGALFAGSNQTTTSGLRRGRRPHFWQQ